MTGALAALFVGLLAAVAWLRRQRDRARVDAAVEHGRAETATAQAAVVAEVAAEKSHAVEVAAEYREAVAAEVAHPEGRPPGVPTSGPSPLDRIRAADRVRAKIARRKP